MDDGSFQQHGYELLRGLVDPTSYYQHMQILYEQGKGDVDRFVPGARVFHNDEKFQCLLAELLPTIEQRARCRLFQTYSYAREYGEGDVLKPHRDRPSCEVTVSICLGPSLPTPWPIWLIDKHNRPQCIELNPGDAVLYKGVEVVHWRQRNVHGPCSQLFLHYVDQSGENAIYRNNAYKPWWFSVEIFGRTFSMGFMPAYTCECGLLTRKRRRGKALPR